MVSFINDILEENNGTLQQEKEFIISGGIKNFLDGYYLMSKLHANSIYGQASTLLKYAEQSYDALHQYLDAQIEGLKLAQAFLKAK
jgi:isopentenyl-diphosphate delta-isomerase